MNFSSKVRKFSTVSTDNVNKIFRGSVIQLFSAVILETPVDTGRLRGNWQTSIEAKIEGETDRNGAQGAIAEVNSVMGSATAKNTVIMANNLPYAEQIEYEGHSAQAPDGMMRKNIARFSAIVDSQIARHKI